MRACSAQSATSFSVSTLSVASGPIVFPGSSKCLGSSPYRKLNSVPGGEEPDARGVASVGHGPGELEDPEAQLVHHVQLFVNPDRVEGMGTVQQDDEIDVGQAFVEDVLKGDPALHRGSVEKDLIAAVEQDMGELPGDPRRVASLVTDEGLTELASQAEGLQDVARQAGVAPLDAVNRLYRLGDLL